MTDTRSSDVDAVTDALGTQAPVTIGPLPRSDRDGMPPWLGGTIGVVLLIILAGWPVGLPVDIKHGQMPGASAALGDPREVIPCYTSGTTGDLVNDPAGITIVEKGGYRHLVD